MILTPSEKEAFFTEGYIIKKAVFSLDEIAEMRTAFDVLWETSQRLSANLEENSRGAVMDKDARYTFQNKALRHIAWCGNAHEILAKYGSDSRLLQIASELLDSQEMEQLINQAHFKMAGDGVSFPWHQDSEHRGMSTGRFVDVNKKGSYVQIATALDDVNSENGPLGIIPKSCQIGHIEHVRSHTGAGMLPEGTIDDSQALYPTPKCGDILIFGPYTVHGSTENKSDRSRRIFINGFAHPQANQGAVGKMHRLESLAAC